MENVEIARLLEEYADLLEIRDDNPFRVRSYRKAAQTVAGLSRPVAQLMAAGEDVTELPGIGSSMAAHLKEIVETGGLAALGQMRQELPKTLTELMRLETLGPKKARKLYDELGVTSVSELAAAIDAGKVEALPGFGKKTAANLRRAISQSAQHARRFLLADADQLVQPLLAYLRTGPGIEALDVAGSYRRRQETVGDIDILAICENPPPLMHHFQAYPDAEHVEMAGTTRGTIVLRSGLQVDLRIVPRRSYGAALHYFTGSKAHNVAVRTLGGRARLTH
jgi:DNA polymerase (family 10)